MSILNTSIQRPYFKKEKYPRVVDTSFRELTKSSSTNNTEEIIKEYKRLKYSFPPEIHNFIYTNSSKALGIDPEEENFEEIDKLNHKLDKIEAEQNQEIIVDAREHPHFKNGTFIRGYKYVAHEYFDSEDDFESVTYEQHLTYYFIQKGHKREIENFDLFYILYTLVNKKEPNKNERRKIPILQPGELLNIPIASPIFLGTLGSETKLTNIFELPLGYFDASDISKVIQQYQNSLTPEEVEIKAKAFQKSNYYVP